MRKPSVESLVLVAVLVAAALVFTRRGPTTHGGVGGVPTPVDPRPEIAREPVQRQGPISLTATDGTGLRLIELVGRAVVQDPLAFTELVLTFENPEARRLEGRFEIVLPEAATISRFAMKIGAYWQEGEVVERRAAQRAYEDALHRRQDPALLEHGAANEFTARVFPIDAHEKKTLVVSYSQELVPDAPYVLPLQGLPRLGRVDFRIAVPGAAGRHELVQKDFLPSADFALRAAVGRGPAAARNGELVVARVQAALDAQPELLRSALVLLDTSASQALELDSALAQVENMAAQVARDGGAGARFAVVAFDQTSDLMYDGTAAAFGVEVIERIRRRQALGASNLEAALGFAAEHASRARLERVVVVSDGVATAGAAAPERLVETTNGLAKHGVKRLDAVVLGGIRDETLLRKLAAALPNAGSVVSASSGWETIARRLRSRSRSDVPVQVEGARWSWPARLDAVQPGDEVLVYAELPEAGPIRVSLGGAPLPDLEPRQVARPLVERAWARAQIASLDGRKAAAEHAKRIVELSVKYRVLSPLTAFVVLENEAEYARFGINRAALADILTVTDGRIEVRKRSAGDLELARRALEAARPEPPQERKQDRARGGGAPAPPGGLGEELDALERQTRPGEPARAAAVEAPPPAQAAPASEATPVAEPAAPPPAGAIVPGATGGSLGNLARGSGADTQDESARGSGAAASRVAAARGAAMVGAADVSGGRVSDAARVVAGMRAGFRACYNRGLVNTPDMHGALRLKLRVGPTGEVLDTKVEGARGLSQEVVACVKARAGAAMFSAPDGGKATISFPLTFALQSGGEPSDRPSPRDDFESKDPERGTKPYSGRFEQVMAAIERRDSAGALAAAAEWRKAEPADVLSLVALGEALEASGDALGAARAYGSIVDLFPSRADLRRYAGERLERIDARPALELAADSYEKAREQRPDHPSSHRLYAFAKLKLGDAPAAFEALAGALTREYPAGRFAGVKRILAEDLGLAAAAWKRAEPGRAAQIAARLREAGGSVEDAPSLRFVLVWETDANDVDFHIYDAKRGHAYYSKRHLQSGGELYADVTTGYGPECFTVRLARAQRAAPYVLQAHYYSRGPMGYGMGKLQVIDHDGHGKLRFEERPFVVMVDRAFVDLGSVGP
jgi:hypothetical protein